MMWWSGFSTIGTVLMRTNGMVLSAQSSIVPTRWDHIDTFRHKRNAQARGSRGLMFESTCRLVAKLSMPRGELHLSCPQCTKLTLLRRTIDHCASVCHHM
jgi:hypothetical protein